MAAHKHFLAVLLLSLHVFSCVVSFAQADVVQLPQDELVALQGLLGAWSKSTVDVSSSLPGWISFDPTSTSIDPCYQNSWRGVFCYIRLNKTATALRDPGDKLYNAAVVGLTISDASIVGTLPTAILDFTQLVTLTLTGNPGLTGPIPPTPTTDRSYRWTLKSVDLHSNAFNGLMPELFFEYSQWIEDLDLSNNDLEGPIPASMGLNGRLRTLNLSNNTLDGSLPFNISGNWTNLVSADLSSNKFTGNMPNLSSLVYLHTLNLSHNEFGGEIDISVLSPAANASLETLDLSDNRFTGPMPNFGIWTNVSSLNLSSNNFDAGAFPPWLLNLKSLQLLGLRNVSLTGELNLSQLSSFTALRKLELDDNKITGTLNIDSLLHTNSSLQTISLKNNQIGVVIFSSKNVSNLPIFLELKGNPYCSTKASDIQRCLCEHQCYNTDPALKKGIIIGFAVGGSIAAVVMIIGAILHWKNRRDRRYLLLTVHEKFAEYEMKPTFFAYSELQQATNDFSSAMMLGEGGFGTVYEGTLTDRSKVAVKKLRPNAQQNMDVFVNEVVLLTSVKHRNLVKLKGCCLHGDQRLLVYEFVDNYDLAETLFEHKGNQLVTWPARFNICLGVAHGLHYLHAGVDKRIIHRDIKASNVLLDSNFHPKIADFGLAMLFPNEDTHIIIGEVAGTKGYLAPEYATQGHVSVKVDVFSFGVLALEVVSGRKNISFDVPADKSYLTNWAWKLSKERRLTELVDRTLSIQNDEEGEVYRVITTALACLQTAAERRPTMAQVVGMLQGDIVPIEPVRGQLNENVNHRAFLGLNSSATTLMPVDEESQLLHLGKNCSSGSSSRAGTELSAISGR